MGDLQETNKVYICRPIYRTDEFIETYQIKERSQPWHMKMKHFLQKSCHCSKQKMVQMIPFINVVLTYQIKSFIFSDLLAGLTVAFMQLPQGMAYAMLSGLPPVIGLYMGFFPILCYCLLGTSKHVSVGPIVVVCLMIGALMEERFPKEEGYDSALAATSILNESFSEIISQNDTISVLAEPLIAEKIKFAMAITLVCGITQILMSVIQLGAIVRLMSDAIVSAFSTGVAIHVITSQLKYLLGVQVPRFSGVLSVPKTLLATAERIPNSNYPELLLSITVMVVIYLVKTQINERYKSHLRVPVPIDLIMVISILFYFIVWSKKLY